ncbi:MAG: Histidine kinaselike ATPase protein [Marmoricola sp.]|nr:Histidine kinaselike ATPase protein [Marmoricola sp.]
MQPPTDTNGFVPQQWRFELPASGDVDAAALVLHLAAELNSQADLPSVLQTVTDTATTLSGARFGAFFYNASNETGLSYVLHVISGVDAASFFSLPSPRITALFEPTFTGQGSVRSDDVATDPRFSGFPANHLPVRSYLATPVVGREGAVIGALLLGHSDPAMFTETSERAVQLVAAHAAVAVENARLFTEQNAALELAEERAQSLELLQEVTSRLAGMFSLDDAIDALVDTLVTHLGIERMGLYRLEGDVLRAMRAREIPANDADALPWTAFVDLSGEPDGLRASLGLGGQDLAHFASIPLSAPTLAREALRTGKVVAVADRDQFLAGYPELARAMPNVHAAVAVPLRVFGSDHGSLTLTWLHPMRFSPARRRLMEAVGEQLCSTLERIDLFTSAAHARSELRRHVDELTDASQTLQRSFLPEELPTSDVVEVAVRYAPGAKNAEVGGDWYDMVVAPSGRVTLVIGDVQGHSFSAAAVMGRVSAALHAYLLEGHQLDVALTRVNPIVEQSGLLVTCCLVSLDPRTGEMTIARAGHPVPVYRRGDLVGQMPEEGGGPPLGVFGPDARWEVRNGWAQPGDRLLLFTDGLIERSDVDMDTQLESLVELMAAQGDARLDEAADTILSKMAPARGDDVALLVADYSGIAGSPKRRSVASLVVADLASVAEARQFTTRVLRDWSLEGAVDIATLLVSELVTNALLHTQGPATLELVPAGDRVRIHVSDPVAHGPEAQGADLESEHGRGVMLVEAMALDWGVDPHGAGKLVWAEVATT